MNKKKSIFGWLYIGLPTHLTAYLFFKVTKKKSLNDSGLKS